MTRPFCEATKDSFICNLKFGHIDDHKDLDQSGGCVGWPNVPAATQEQPARSASTPIYFSGPPKDVRYCAHCGHSESMHHAIFLKPHLCMVGACDCKGFSPRKEASGSPRKVGEDGALREAAERVLNEIEINREADYARGSDQFTKDLELLARAALSLSSPIEPPPVAQIKVPFTRALTVLLTKDMPAVQQQADSDLKAIEEGSQVFTHPTNEAYFHRLRLRVAEHPELADKIAVFYQEENGQVREVKLRFEDELLWPVGFMQELWTEEAEINRARQAALAPSRQGAVEEPR